MTLRYKTQNQNFLLETGESSSSVQYFLVPSTSIVPVIAVKPPKNPSAIRTCVLCIRLGLQVRLLHSTSTTATTNAAFTRQQAKKKRFAPGVANQAFVIHLLKMLT